MSKQVKRTKEQKRAYAIMMNKKRGGSGASSRYVRAIPQSVRKPPIYRSVPMNGNRLAITGGGKYGLQRAGQDIGRGLGHVLDRIFGSGDYSIQANSIMGGIYDPPELHNRSDKTVCVRHREYITDISASTNFSLQSFNINPGLFGTFPWLSQVAEAFEEYRFTGLVFEYKTLSADYTTASSAALGYVIMATQYNVLSPNFPDKITMENYEFANSGKPSETFLHPVECKRSLNPVSELFVRTGTPTTGDFRLYDHGNFQIATGGNSGNGILGELWCTFEIEFYKPKLVDALGTELLTDHWYASTGITNSTPLGNPVLRSGSNLGTTIPASPGNQVFFPPYIQDGIYYVQFQISGTSTALIGPSNTFNNCTPLNVWRGDLFSSINNSSTNSAIYMQSFIIQINARNASIVIGSGTYPASATSMDMWITQINGNIIT